MSALRVLKSMAGGGAGGLFWVAIGLLPLFVYGISMLVVFRHQQAQVVEHMLQQAAGGVAHLVERAIREQLGVMNGMAASYAFDREDLETARQEAQRLWRLHPEWRTVIVTDANRQLLNLRFPAGEPLPALRDSESLAQVWANQQPVVGGLVHGYVGIRVPVVREGRTIYTIAVPIDPRFFGEQLRASTEDRPWTAAVIDGAGKPIATAGSQAEDKTRLQEVPAGAQGFLADGVDYLAWAPVGGYGWRVAVVAPAAAIEQPFARTRWAVYLGGAFAAVLTSLLLMVLGSAWASRREAARLIPEVEERKRAQEALTLTIDRLRLAHEAAHSGAWEWDLQTNRNVWSDELWRLYGLAPHSCEPSYAAWLATIHPEDRNRTEQTVRDAARQGVTLHAEWRVKHTDGAERWLMSRGQPLRNGQGRIARYLGIVIDITERKQWEKTLVKSELQVRETNQILEAILEHTHMMVAYLDADFNFIWANLAYAETCCREASFFPGKNHFELYPHEENQAIFKRVVQTGEAYFVRAKPFEFPDQPERGVTYWDWSLIPVKDHEGKITGLVFTLAEVTEQIKAEEENRNSEERNRWLIEALTDAILVRSGERITFASPAALRLFRAKDADELIGKKYLDLVHPDDHAVSTERARKNLEENWVAPLREHRIVALDGQVVEVESTGLPFKHRGETQVFGVFRDITERKRANQEKEKLEAQLRQAQKMEAIGTLAGGIAHDFNNILSVIIGNAEMLGMSEEISSSTSRENVAPILAASSRAKKLVSQILTFSRQGDQQKLLISLKPVIKETIEFLRSSLPSTIQLKQYINPEAGTILADPTQMQQVLMNLCTNAAHAMEGSAGELKIELENATITEADSRVTADVEPGSYVKMSVSDTGHGMEAWVRERIFDPYFTTKGPGKGTGLGLSVVHGIVKSHGGMIQVYSEPGAGTTFRVYFPRTDGLERDEARIPEPLPRGTEKVLMVDDEPELADLGKRMLEHLGYRVDVRTSPLEALELFRADPERFDAIITDMTMPHLTGLNLAREILAIRPTLPIILCTGFSEQADEAKSHSAGVRSFLFKPLVISELANALRKALDETPSEDRH